MIERKVEFTIVADDHERSLFVVRECSNDVLVITPTLENVIYSGSREDPVYGGVPLHFKNIQYTVHFCSDHPVMSRINYKKLDTESEKVKRIVTNGLKKDGFYFPLCYFSYPDLRTPQFDLKNPDGERICLGRFPQSVFCFCYTILLSSHTTQPPDIGGKYFGIDYIDFSLFRMHVISTCLHVPFDKHAKSLRYTLNEYPTNLNSFSEQQLKEISINSANEAEFMNYLSQHLKVTREMKINHYEGPVRKFVVDHPEVILPVSPKHAYEFLEFVRHQYEVRSKLGAD